jgi:hypothetical protein
MTSATCFLATAVFDKTPSFLAPALIDHYDVVQAFMNAAVKPLFAPNNCAIIDTFAEPGPDAGDSTPSMSTGKYFLVNGVYQ